MRRRSEEENEEIDAVVKLLENIEMVTSNEAKWPYSIRDIFNVYGNRQYRSAKEKR